MLGKPEYGWSTLKVGDFAIDVSYLTSVARECLKAFLEYRPWHPICIHFDAESDGDVYLVVTSWETFIIGSSWMPEDSVECGLLEHDVKADALAKELYSDISANIKEWASWDIFTVHKFQYWKEFTRNWVWLKIALWKLNRKFDKAAKDECRRLERFQNRISKKPDKTKILSPKEKI